MVNNLVTRDQFNVKPDGVVHKPTDAAFIPNPSDPSSGTVQLGQLANTHPTAREYPVEDILRIIVSYGLNLWRATSGLLPTPNAVDAPR
jgi:hypothetical protein